MATQTYNMPGAMPLARANPAGLINAGMKVKRKKRKTKRKKP